MESLKRRLLSGSAWAFAGRIATAFTAFASTALLARLLSPGDFGVYLLAFSVVSVGALVGALGLDHAVVRLVAESVGLNQLGRARRVLGKVLVLGLLGALGVGVLYMLVGGVVGRYVFHAPALAAVTGLVAGWMALTALQQLLAGAFRSLHDIRLASVFYSLAAGALLTVSLAVVWLLMGRATLVTVLLLTVGSGFASAMLASWLLYRKMASLPSGGATDRVARFGGILGMAWPLLSINVLWFALGQGQVDLWIVGAFRPQHEAAIFGAAARAAILVGMPALVFNAVVSPLIVEMYAQGKKRELERALRVTTTLAAIPAFLTMVAFISLGAPIMGFLFGDYYREGATILALLSVGQFVNVWVGPCGQALMMTEHQGLALAITVAGGLLMIVLGVGAVGPYGATGVAVATAVGIAVTNMAYWLGARYKVGLWTHPKRIGLSALIRDGIRVGK